MEEYESHQEVEVDSEGNVISDTTRVEKVEEIERMRNASGRVQSDDPLVRFLYLLARDELPSGKIERLLDEAVFGHRGKVIFTNGWLAEWAVDAAARLDPFPS